MKTCFGCTSLQKDFVSRSDKRALRFERGASQVSLWRKCRKASHNTGALNDNCRSDAAKCRKTSQSLPEHCNSSRQFMTLHEERTSCPNPRALATPLVMFNSGCLQLERRTHAPQIRRVRLKKLVISEVSGGKSQCSNALRCVRG